MQINTIQALSPSPLVSKTRFHIPTLDGFRAVAFLLVFIAHSGLGHLFPGGSFGVTIFFFLSGYLITTLLRKEYSQRHTLDIRRWYLRRALRILPLFYLALGLGLLAVRGGLLQESWDSLNLSSVIAQATHWGNYWMIQRGEDHLIPGFTVFWSLAVEAHFYLLFPWFFLTLQRLNLSPKQQTGVILGLCGLILLWRCVLVFGFHVPESRTYMGSDTRLDGILFGSALALYQNPALDLPIGRDRQWLWFGFPMGVTLLATTVFVKNPEFRETLRYTLQGLALYPIFITAIRCAQHPVFSWLDSSALKLIGRLSYPLYLTHYILLFMLGKALPSVPVWERAIVGLGLSIVLALFLDLLLERPVQKIRASI